MPPALAALTRATTVRIWVVYKRRFNAYGAEHVVEELVGLVQKYRITNVALLDSNFPVDLRRAIAIAQGIRDSGVKFTWTFQASTDFICRMSQEDVQLLADSGVRYMGFGTESNLKGCAQDDEQAPSARR